VVIRSKVQLDKHLLDKAKNLKFIARVGAGMENIDVTYAESIGIKCLHAPEGNRDAVGEHALAMLLALFNNICKADDEVRNGKWIREGNRGIELGEKTVGIIGYGNMGQAFAQRLKGFNCKVLAYDKYKTNYSNEFAQQATLQNLFDNCDVISLHVPLTEETEFFIDSTFFNSFKKPIYIINTARGKVLKTADLVKAMQNKKVLGACLDVLEYEEGSFENLQKAFESNDFKYLAQSKNVVLSPHVGGWTHESNLKLAQVLVEKILKIN
jgi:D-3-phosphoglycerate dehydrogenase